MRNCALVWHSSVCIGLYFTNDSFKKKKNKLQYYGERIGISHCHVESFLLFSFAVSNVEAKALHLLHTTP